MPSVTKQDIYDIIIEMNQPIPLRPLPGYKDVQPFVYAGFFPVSNEDYNDLKEAIEKLSLSDSVLDGAL